ncbi:MAG: isoaspartyl peptidase/L-asparaginase family protein [Thermoleophilaceae bacterium]
MAEPALAVHGGAGPRAPRDEAPYRDALGAALDAGWRALGAGGPLDAVQAAVELLEDAPLFNAGRGSVLTADGRVEMDAAIASAAGAGAVACVTRVRNAVRLARGVMERTPHVLIAGRGAEALAVEWDLETMKPDWFVVTRERDRLARAAAPETAGGGTVGAVARGADGTLAAATSTGGVRGQLPGRVGDSPLLGAGTYADERCAVSATGDGEAVIRAVAAYEIARLASDGVPLAEAAERVLRERVGAHGGSGGVIALAADGPPALPFTTAMMHRGWRVGEAPPQTAI